MARPKLIKGVVTAVYLLEEQKQQLERIATQKGMSLSEYLRMLIAQHLSQLNNPDPPVDPPSQEKIDPVRELARMELKELESGLDRLEDLVSNFETRVEQMASNPAVFVEYQEIERLRKEWHSKKKWLYSFSRFLDPGEIMPTVQRLIKLKERMENAWQKAVEIRKTRRSPIIYYSR
jgi:DNA repair exonuclease SbcCD ATPase subunit